MVGKVFGNWIFFNSNHPSLATGSVTHQVGTDFNPYTVIKLEQDQRAIQLPKLEHQKSIQSLVEQHKLLQMQQNRRDEKLRQQLQQQLQLQQYHNQQKQQQRQQDQSHMQQKKTIQRILSYEQQQVRQKQLENEQFMAHYAANNRLSAGSQSAVPRTINEFTSYVNAFPAPQVSFCQLLMTKRVTVIKTMRPDI